MKRGMSLLIGVLLVLGVHANAYASDWDIAGKVLTGIEGMRILTGGRVDIIGTITGVGSQPVYQTAHRGRGHDEFRRQERCERVWVPHYVWEKRWVPEHSEYDGQGREMMVEGHYVRCQVESGGHWENVRGNRDRSCRNRY